MANGDANQIREEIRKARDRAGISFRQLAEISGVESTHICKFLSPDQKVDMNTDKAAALMSALGLRIVSKASQKRSAGGAKKSRPKKVR